MMIIIIIPVHDEDQEDVLHESCCCDADPEWQECSVMRQPCL